MSGAGGDEEADGGGISAEEDSRWTGRGPGWVWDGFEGPEGVEEFLEGLCWAGGPEESPLGGEGVIVPPCGEDELLRGPDRAELNEVGPGDG